MLKHLQHVKKLISFDNPNHRRIVFGFLWVGLFVLVGKIAGAAKEMSIAWRYGVSSLVDAYVFLINLINWPVSIWFSILSVVLIPTYAHIRSESPKELPRFRSQLFGLTLVIGFSLGAIYWFFLPQLLHSKFFGISASLPFNDAIRMAQGLVLLGPLGILISFFSASLLATGTHRNTLFECIPALILLSILVFGSDTSYQPLIWGTVLGGLFHAIALSFALYLRGELPSIRLAQSSPVWQFFWTSIGIMSFGQALSSLTTLVDQFFATGLPEGTLATLSYANRVLALLLGLGATTISRATLPVFSDSAADAVSDTIKIVRQWAFLMAFVALLILILSWLLAPWGIRILFQRGAFTAQNTESVTLIFRLSLFQILFYFPSLVILSFLASRRKYVLIAISGAVNLFSKLIFCALFVPPFGIQGLAISTVLMYAVSALLLAWLVFSPLFAKHKSF